LKKDKTGRIKVLDWAYPQAAGAKERGNEEGVIAGGTEKGRPIRNVPDWTVSSQRFK